jgi:Ni,Fe-hydrogenase maturation factor
VSLLAALTAVARETPEIVVIGAAVGEVRPFTNGLSPPLEAAVSGAVRLVLVELRMPSADRSAQPARSRR